MSTLEIDENARYALKSEFERERRRGMLDRPHIKPLVLFLNEIKYARGPNCEIPYFDPCDGGIHSKAIFLLESPGKKAKGSGFISRNNPDETANNIRRLFIDAKLDRSKTLLWNIVPWYLGRAPTDREIKEALPFLKDLVKMLANLRVIVLVGIKAWRGESEIASFAKIPIIKTYHPSPLNFNSRPDMKGLVLENFKRQQASFINQTK